jgi:hypothetical protein
MEVERIARITDWPRVRFIICIAGAGGRGWTPPGPKAKEEDIAVI